MSTEVPAAPTAPEAGAAPTESAAKPEPEGTTVYRTQEEFDRAFGSRLERERNKLTRDFEEKAEGLKKTEREAVEAAFNGRLVKSKVEALAETLGFHDVKDALGVIDKDKLPIKDGEPDSDAIKAALEKLATDKPYLVKTKDEPITKRERGKPKLPGGNPADPATEKKGSAAEALRALAAQRKHS
jgi:hypothetical protein